MATRYTQQNRVSIQLLVGPVGAQKDYGTFTTTSDLGTEGEKVQHGEGPVASGTRSRADAELQRPYTDADIVNEAELDARYQQPVTLTRSILGDDGLPLGRPRIFTGTLGGVKGPEGDATGNDRGMLSVTCFLNIAAA